MTNAKQIDLNLLYNDFDALITRYQAKIRMIARKNIQKGLFYLLEEADIIQSVNEQLLKRKKKIQQQYVQKASVSIYFNAIINNICIDLYRKQKKRITTTSYPHDAISSPLFLVLVEKEDYLFNQLIIQEELEKLNVILKTYPEDYAKLILCLKLMSGVVINYLDVLAYCPTYDLKKIELFLGAFKAHYHHLTDKFIYNELNKLFNDIENKKITTDAVKKWIEYKIKQIIHLLNKSSDHANYDKSSLKILIKMFYEKQNKVLCDWNG